MTVKKFHLGYTKVKICDDYCRDKTKEEVKKTLNRISRIAINELRRDSR